MTVTELLDRLGGSVLSNKARVAHNGVSVVVARLAGADWIWTPEGQAIAASLATPVAIAAPTPAPAPAPTAMAAVASTLLARTRKGKGLAVESTPPPSES